MTPVTLRAVARVAGSDGNLTDVRYGLRALFADKPPPTDPVLADIARWVRDPMLTSTVAVSRVRDTLDRELGR